MSGEDRFVEKLRALLPRSERVRIGPGDDAAVLSSRGADLVLTTDLLVEGVDFLPDEDPEKIGRRALAVNLSDIAAMGGRPEFFLLSIAFRAERGEEFPLAVARGALSRATPLGLDLVGGDLSDAKETVVSVLVGGVCGWAAAFSGLKLWGLALGAVITVAMLVVLARRGVADGRLGVMLAFGFAFLLLTWPLLWLVVGYIRLRALLHAPRYRAMTQNVGLLVWLSWVAVP